MTLVEQVTKDIAAAMKARDQARRAPRRMLKAALTNRAVERGRPLEATEERQVVLSLIKQRREAIEQFRHGGRTDLAERETAEIAVLESYLPPALDPAELERLVASTIAELGAQSVKDLGRVMKAVMPKLAPYAVDGRAVNDLVRRRLGGA
jgi:uncharacterized protein YqeY